MLATIFPDPLRTPMRTCTPSLLYHYSTERPGCESAKRWILESAGSPVPAVTFSVFGPTGCTANSVAGVRSGLLGWQYNNEHSNEHLHLRAVQVFRI